MLKRHYTTIAFGASLLFLIIGFSLYYVRLANIKSLIVVHYLARHGADFLGNTSDALNILISGFVFLCINYMLAIALYNRNLLMTDTISSITLLILFLILIALMVIINAN